MKFVRRMIFFIALSVVGIITLVNGIKGKIEHDKPRADIETLKVSDLYEGRIVEGTIYELWDEFAYTSEYDETLGIKTSKERTTDRYFAMPLESSFGSESLMFIAVSSRKSEELRVFEKMEKETNDYYNGKEYDEYTSVHFVGKVKKLSNEYLQYFREYIAYQYDISEAEAEKYYTPYVLVSYGQGGSNIIMIIVGSVFSVVGVLGTIFFIVRKVLTGR